MTVLFLIALCIGIGMFAKSKGRSAWGWGIAAAFISPIIAGIILALLKDKKQEQSVNKVDMEQQQLKERVAVNEVQVNQRFQNVEQQISTMKKETGLLKESNDNVLLDEGMKTCPHCGETIKRSAVKCRYCGSDLEVIQMKECPYCKELIRADATKCKYCRSDLEVWLSDAAANTIEQKPDVKSEKGEPASTHEEEVLQQKAEMPETSVASSEAVEKCENAVNDAKEKTTEVKEQAGGILLCPNCHAQLLPDAKFCIICGTKIKTENQDAKN